MVYLDPTHGPAPSWLVSSAGRALHRYRRGHGFKSRTGLNFFQVLFSTTRFSSVLSCEDLLISSIHRSANIWISYFKSRTGLNFFQVLFKTTRFSSVLSCEDLLISGIKSWFNSNWIRQSFYNSFSRWWRSCKKISFVGILPSIPQ